jgi:hypothetical protein
MVKCEECGVAFDDIGTHFRYNESHRPSIPEHEMNIIRGLLMSDGSVSTYQGSNPMFRVEMTNRTYLLWLDRQLGWISTGVKDGRSSEELRGDSKDLYYLLTRRHPDLDELQEWYKSGQKVWPKDLVLTPTVLKHLYVGDGHYVEDKHYIKVALHNERGHVEKVNKYFQEAGLPEPDYWNKQEASTEVKWLRPDPLFEYMGEAPPGFEYKWPNQNL